MMRWIPVGLALTCLLVASAGAQFETGFEDYAGTPGGIPITGQQGWYIPAGTTSVDYNVYTYFDNALGIPFHPDPTPPFNDFFAGGVGPGSPTFARAQHDIEFTAATWEIGFDFCAAFLGTPPSSNNVGSFSAQPDPNDYIQLMAWVPGQEGVLFTLGYMAYDAGGVQFPQPGVIPTPAWDNLMLNNWYRAVMIVDFPANMITEVRIQDIQAGTPMVTFTPTDWYLEGGSGGSSAPSTGFRMFAGGGVDGNVLAFDNLFLREVVATSVEPTTWGAIKAHF